MSKSIAAVTAFLEPIEGPTPGTIKNRRYLLTVLTIIYAVNFLDRQLLGILVEPIKHDLHLSDTQMGLLAGTAFAALYITFGLLVGSLVDTCSRRAIIAGSLAVWSAMTSMCGLARSFTEMFLFRVGVGIGEAGCVPAAHSLIVDSFPLNQRAGAIAIFTTGASIGAFFGFLIGGWVNVWFNWRTAFLVCGAPGVILAIVAWATLLDSRPTVRKKGVTEAVSALPAQLRLVFGDAFLLCRQKSFSLVAISAGLNAIVTYGLAAWLSSFFIRYYALNTATAGTLLSIVLGGGGAVGCLAGGWIADRIAVSSRANYARLAAIVSIVSTPLFIYCFLTSSIVLAVALLIPAIVISSAFAPAAFASIHGVLRHEKRGFGIGLFLFIGNLLGIGAGSLLIGVLSDAMAISAGQNALRYSLIVVVALGLVAAAGYLIAARRVEAEWVG